LRSVIERRKSALLCESRLNDRLSFDDLTSDYLRSTIHDSPPPPVLSHLLKFRRCLLTLLVAGACGMLGGCIWGRQWFGQREPFGPRAPCALKPNATADEIVAYLNQNTGRIQSWRAEHVTISGPGSPFSANAMLAVEAPRNFRLRAVSLGQP